MVEPVYRILIRIPSSGLLEGRQLITVRILRPHDWPDNPEHTAFGLESGLVAGKHQRLPIEGVGHHVDLDPVNRGQFLGRQHFVR